MSANPVEITTGPTCTMGCKLPHGLTLQLFNKQGQVTAQITLQGANAARIVGGYGLTPNVPKEFAEEWLKRNQKHPAVMNETVFMHTDTRNAEAVAKERRNVLTGIEPLDPIANARKFRLDPDAEAIQAYNKQKAENPDRGRQIRE